MTLHPSVYENSYFIIKTGRTLCFCIVLWHTCETPDACKLPDEHVWSWTCRLDMWASSFFLLRLIFFQTRLFLLLFPSFSLFFIFFKSMSMFIHLSLSFSQPLPCKTECLLRQQNVPDHHSSKCTAQTLTFLSCLLEIWNFRAPSSPTESVNLPPKSDSLKSESL